MSYFIQEGWRLKRASHVLRFYGSWDAVQQASTRDPESGVSVVPLPPSLRAIIDADPECQPPPPKVGVVKRILRAWGWK